MLFLLPVCVSLMMAILSYLTMLNSSRAYLMANVKAFSFMSLVTLYSSISLAACLTVSLALCNLRSLRQSKRKNSSSGISPLTSPSTGTSALTSYLKAAVSPVARCLKTSRVVSLLRFTLKCSRIKWMSKARAVVKARVMTATVKANPVKVALVLHSTLMLLASLTLTMNGVRVT